jgi:hypothetical protein
MSDRPWEKWLPQVNAAEMRRSRGEELTESQAALIEVYDCILELDKQFEPLQRIRWAEDHVATATPELLRHLRSTRDPLALTWTNLLADLHKAAATAYSEEEMAQYRKAIGPAPGEER